MLTTPNVYGEDCPFLLLFAADKERVVRSLADAGVAMIISAEGASLTRVELPGCDRRQAIRLVERVTRRLRAEMLEEESDKQSIATSCVFISPNRLTTLGLLDD
jgi:hypothetical protein